jgi:hypothetical protein
MLPLAAMLRLFGVVTPEYSLEPVVYILVGPELGLLPPPRAVWTEDLAMLKRPPPPIRFRAEKAEGEL